MIQIALLFWFAAVSWAQVPIPCESPKQWEGRRVATEELKQIQEVSKYSYDAINMRTRSIEEVEVGKEREYYDVLHLYKENKVYRLNLKTRQCNVSAPPYQFFETAIPEGSKLMLEAKAGVAGIPLEQLIVQNWGITLADGARYSIGVTVPSCVPIFSTYYNKSFGFLMQNFYDIRVGILDPSVFVPPKECSGL